MTLRSLARVRAKVERLASNVVRDGCPVCREDEARTEYHWDSGGGLDDAPTEPRTKTCVRCGRAYQLSCVVFAWQSRVDDAG